MGCRSIRVGFNDLEWPWKGGVRGQNFLADLHNYPRMVWPKMIKFGTVIGGENIFLGVNHAHGHIPKRRGPSALNFMGPPIYAQTVGPIRRRNLVRKHGKVACFGGQPRPHPKGARPQRASYFCDLHQHYVHISDIDKSAFVWRKLKRDWPRWQGPKCRVSTSTRREQVSRSTLHQSWYVCPSVPHSWYAVPTPGSVVE